MGHPDLHCGSGQPDVELVMAPRAGEATEGGADQRTSLPTALLPYSPRQGRITT
jgi:hypothetical protein